ncbi:MAG: hypothetical protein CMM27_10365 [Rhodospirillaceae bacterium]|nr:hypothetical protein [Rhodospirillaceae bacterium]|tara:strand:+ start:4634 stop:5296 length:663 start_codon:yes stop_codon:yes gene_type:complete
MAHTKDSQKGRVYAAELAIEEHKGRTFDSIEEVYKFLHGVIERDTFARWFPRAYSQLTSLSDWERTRPPKWRLNDRRYKEWAAYDHKKVFGREEGLWVSWNHRNNNGRGGGAYWMPGDKRIQMSDYHANEMICLHELAHAVCQYEFGTGVKHHWQFCMVYLKLVGNVMGVEARNILRQSFKDHKVKYTKPRAKRELSEEQKEVLRARIAVARAAKEAKNT